MSSEIEALRQQLRAREQEAEQLRRDGREREQAAQQREQAAKQREQAAQQREQEAQQREQAARQREREAERLRDEDRQRYERRIGKTTLPEFLDACHTHLCLGLTIQPDSTQSTQGDAANADNKPRPDRILPWPEFDAEQAHTWDELMGSEFVLERHFTSLHTLEESGEAIRRRQMGSELDLNNFARFTVEDPVSQIIERLSEDNILRNRFGLKGSVKFENHSNTLSPDRTMEEMQSLSISDKPRRSKRLQAHANESGRTKSSKSSGTKSSRPRADQFCVYNTGGDGETEHRVAALTIEYKAPHKLTLGHIYEGLGEMNLDEVVEEGENESVAIRCRRLVAAVITQGFSYMVRAGLEYGEIYTGEATIFLRIPDDPSSVYYSLSVPKGDVGTSTGWDEPGNQSNRLHLTAVGQAVAFTLRALQTPPRSAQWINKALRQLKPWNVVVKEVEDAVADDEVPSSEYRPSPAGTQAIIRSPIQFRPRKNKFVGTCDSQTSSFSSNDDDHHRDTPSRPRRSSNSRNSHTSSNPPSQTSERGGKDRAYSGAYSQRNLGRFCTPNCLMGMINEGGLDWQCPNVKEHGKGRHQLNRDSFMRHIRELLRDQLDYCEQMYIHGTRGAFFKVKLPTFGYTVVAKGTGVECVSDLIYESEIYQRLHPLQGKCMSVHIGDMKVDSLLYYAGAVRIVHMMFLSFGGFPLRSPISPAVVDDAIRALHAIHKLGVMQGDSIASNVLAHPDRPGLIWIDFERAEFIPPREVLGSLSPNRKRNWSHEEGKHRKRTPSSEIREAKTELTRLVGKGDCMMQHKRRSPNLGRGDSRDISKWSSTKSM
ncbi:hypothetical protein V495_00095 [Pseudogymnoascus sp. VKM F-4514 (FW-929)]|nr:hypothetical protein V495_00095 [Pseudogymnoascus sp. VKM F-4514 (FW-929)]KFY67719.1 hypothetical protein V497_00251 [Pseudogymnoascus sp. VKM F-4516 (FW-969)]